MKAWRDSASALRSNAANVPTLVRSTGWVFLSQSIGLALGFLTSALIARSLGPTAQGIFAVTLLIPTVLVLVAGGGLYAANIFYAGSQRIGVQRLVSNSLVVAIGGTLVSSLIVAVLWVAGPLGGLLPGVTPIYVTLALLILFAQTLRQGMTALLLGLKRISQASRADMTYAAVYLGAAFALPGLLRLGVSGALWAYLLGVVSAGAMALFWLAKAGLRPVPTLDLSTLRATLTFGYRGGVGMILQFFTYRLDLILVNILLGAAAAGEYSIASRLSELLWVLPGAAGTVIFTHSASSKAGTTDVLTARVFWATLWLGLACVVALIVIGPVAIPVVFSASFSASYRPMSVLLPGAVLLGSSVVLANDLVGRGHPGLVSLAGLAAFVITITLDFALIPRYGVTGAAVASSIAYTTYFGAIVVLFLRTTQMGLRGFSRHAMSIRLHREMR